MQSVSSRIWTCVPVSISSDDNHYTTGTSLHLYFIKVFDSTKCSLSIRDPKAMAVENAFRVPGSNKTNSDSVGQEYFITPFKRRCSTTKSICNSYKTFETKEFSKILKDCRWWLRFTVCQPLLSKSSFFSASNKILITYIQFETKEFSKILKDCRWWLRFTVCQPLLSKSSFFFCKQQNFNYLYSIIVCEQLL